MNLVDKIVEKRVAHLKKIEEKVSKSLTGNLEKDYEKLIKEPLENPKENSYLVDIYNRAKVHPITWDAIEGISEIAGISNVYHNTINGQIQQVTSAIDNYYRMLLEPIAAQPFFYMDKSIGVEPNCVGAGQVIASLYAFDRPIENLEMQHVLSTSRRDTLLNVLKNFDNLPVIHYNNEEWVDARFDNFSRAFPKEYLRDVILDQVLLIEDSDHIAIAEKNGEIFDFKLERDNFKKVASYSIEEGLWATGVNSLLNLYQHFEKPVFGQWSCVKDRMKSVCSPMALMMEHSLTAEKFNEMRNLYGDDLPIRYFVAESMLREFDPIFNSEVRNRIKDIYKHPKAQETILSKYMPEEMQNLFQ